MLGLLASVALLALFPTRGARHLVATPVWSAEARAAPTRPVGDRPVTEAAVPFRVDGGFGYVELSGRIRTAEALLYGVTLGVDGFIGYSIVSRNIVRRGLDGEFLSSMAAPGYPVSPPDADGVLVIYPDGVGLARYDWSGDIVWRREFVSPITCLDQRAGRTIVGLASGAAYVVQPDGVSSPITLPSSEVPVVLGCAVSSTGQVAVVTGGGLGVLTMASVEADSDRATSYALGSTRGRAVSASPVSEREVPMAFAEDGAHLYIGLRDSVVIRDGATGRRRGSFQAGSVHTLEAAAAFLVTLGRQRGSTILSIATPAGELLLQSSISRHSYGWVGVHGATLLVGESSLLRYDLERK